MKNRNDSPAPEGCTRRLVVPRFIMRGIGRFRRWLRPSCFDHASSTSPSEEIATSRQQSPKMETATLQILAADDRRQSSRLARIEAAKEMLSSRRQSAKCGSWRIRLWPTPFLLRVEIHKPEGPIQSLPDSPFLTIATAMRVLRQEGIAFPDPEDRKPWTTFSEDDSFSQHNVELVHPLPASAEDELGVDIQITEDAANKAAGSGLHEASC